jgi:hypothetical protein
LPWEGGGVFANASLVEAHAPLAIEEDTPAKPNAGKALLRRLLFFGFDIMESSHKGATSARSSINSARSASFRGGGEFLDAPRRREAARC